MRHGLRRLLRVARRLDGDRAMLRALLPVAGAHLPSLPGDEEEERDDTVRGVVTRAVREARGVAAARPEGVRAMSRNAAALEAVIARADLATAAERVFLESESAQGETQHVATSNSSPVRFGSVDASGDERCARLRSWRHLKDVLREHPEVAHRIARHRRRPGRTDGAREAAHSDDAMRAVRAAVDSTLAGASSESALLAEEPPGGDGDPSAAWLRRVSWETLVARRDRARRRAEAREIARRDPVELWTSRLHLASDEDDDLEHDSFEHPNEHPNAAFYRSRLDAVLEEPGGDVLALFREMHDVGCPPSRRLYVDAMRGAGCPEIALRLLWMLAHESGEASEAALRATPLGVSGVFSFQSARGRHPGGKHAVGKHRVGVDGVCERVADAICTAVLADATGNDESDRPAGSIDDGGGHPPGHDASGRREERSHPLAARRRRRTRGHERALAAMGAVTDLGASPSSRVANDVLTRCALAFAAFGPSLNEGNEEKSRRLLRCVTDAAMRAERHGTRLETSTWHALIECAERLGSLRDFFVTCEAFAARGGSVGAETVASLLEWAREVGDEAVAGWAEHELWSTGKGAFLAHLNRPTC